MSKSDRKGKPEGRLRLKNTGKSENISRLTKNEEKIGEFEGLNSSGTDDSLADFKSPKQIPKPLPKSSVQVIKNVKKNTTNRRRENGKRDENNRQNQQSIPSLFAKTQSEESTFVCPLCLKTFSESDIQLIHTKNCAARNNISTEKLLAAVELQEKQGKERKAIGLPSKPIKSAPKKRFPRKLSPDGDPDIQLALALSMSLKEVEQREVLDEGIALAAESDDKVLEMSSSQRKSTLQSFGFSSNKIAEPIVEKRKKKRVGPTVLQSRTQEIREQILTDKIAEVLVGSESITQQQLEACKPVRDIKESKGVLKSKELKKLVNENADLWSRSIFNFEENYYYVEGLRNFFKPFCDDKKEEKSGNLGIVEDVDDKDEEKNGNLEIIEVVDDEKEEKSGNLGIVEEVDDEKEEKSGNLGIVEDVDDKKEEKSGNLGIVEDVDDKKEGKNGNLEIIEDVDDKKEGKSGNLEIIEDVDDEKEEKSGNLEIIEDVDDKKEEIERKNEEKIVESNFSDENAGKREIKDLIDNEDIGNNEGISCLSNDWSQMVASSYLSDVAIFVKDGSCIRAHSLVFWTRCHSLMRDYQNCDGEDDNSIIKNKIYWSHIDRNAALGFLRYVYCGRISLRDVGDLEVLEQMKILGGKYEIKELVKCLEKIENRFLINGIDSNIVEDCGNRDSIIICGETGSIGVSINNKSDFVEEEIKNNEEEMKKNEEKMEKTENKSEKMVNYQINTSADLFDDSEIIDLSQDSPKCSPVPVELKKSINAGEEDLISKKSDLSRFIEKIERRQARDILESDTDEETPVKVPRIFQKNRFKIGNRGDDYSYDFGGKSNEIDRQEGNSEKRTALSILEDEVRARICENVPVINEEIEEEKKSKDDDNLEISDDESLEESMYTKYMKQARENSIEDYRNCLKYENVTERNKSRRKIEKNETEDSKIDEPIPESFNILEDLNFDTWDDISDPSITKNEKIEGKNTEEVHENENLIKSVHDLSDEDDDLLLENDFSRQMNINYSPEVKSPSPIVVSSEDEEISNEKRLTEIFSQVLSRPNSPGKLENDNFDDNYDFEDEKTKIDDDLMKKTFLKNSQLMNKLPSTPENPLKRSRTSSSLQISYDITPPRDYNRMESPELNEELNKYGLKPQRRSRGIQLLEHIYNELHPLVPVDSLPPETADLPDDEDYEPVCKKQQLDSSFSSKKGINAQDDDDDEGMGRIIPEEMDFYQDDGGSHQGESICLKEVFNKLLKRDKELYVKVLAYEPLPLESLCERLRSEGFNGKINDVMSFLDDECITFQVQQKRNKRGRIGTKR